MLTALQKIRDLVKTNRLEAAIDLLIDTVKNRPDEEAHNSAILLAARYKEYEEHKLNNTLSEKVLGTEIAAIRDTVLELAEHLPAAENEEQPADTVITTRLDRVYSILIKSFLLLLLVISVGVLVIGVMIKPLFDETGDVTNDRYFLFGVATTGIASSAFFYPRFIKKTA